MMNVRLACDCRFLYDIPARRRGVKAHGTSNVLSLGTVVGIQGVYRDL